MGPITRIGTIIREFPQMHHCLLHGHPLKMMAHEYYGK